MSETIFADGLWFNEKRENAPDFVLGGISIDVDKFAHFVNDNQKDGKVNIQILRSKAGKPYCALDTFEPQKKAEESNPFEPDSEPLPF